MTESGTTQLLEGKKSAAAIRDDAAATVQRLRAVGVVPSLALVLATSDESAAWYTRAIARAGEKVGIDVRVERLADDASAATVRTALQRLSADDTVHGIILQMPLPPGVDVRRGRDRDRAGEGRGRREPGEPRAVDRGPAGLRAGHRGRRAADPRRQRHRAGGPARGRRRAQPGRRQAGGDDAAGARRDRHRLPLADPRPGGAHQRGGGPRRGGGPAADARGGARRAGCGGGRRRDHAGRERQAGRRRGRRGRHGPGGRVDAGARRRRAGDDSAAAAQHGGGGAARRADPGHARGAGPAGVEDRVSEADAPECEMSAL